MQTDSTMKLIVAFHSFTNTRNKIKMHSKNSGFVTGVGVVKVIGRIQTLVML